MANNFPTSITNIKTSNIKIIQVSTSANVNSEKVTSFTFPVEFTPIGFIGVASNIVKDNYSGSQYNTSNSPNLFIQSFSYIDEKFIALRAKPLIISNQPYVNFSLATNYNTSYSVSKSYNVNITSAQVVISPLSTSSNYTFFLQRNNTSGYWLVVYWN